MAKVIRTIGQAADIPEAEKLHATAQMFGAGLFDPIFPHEDANIEGEPPDEFPVINGILQIRASAVDSHITAEKIEESLRTENLVQVFIECNSWEDREKVLELANRFLDVMKKMDIDKDLDEPVIVSVAGAHSEDRNKLVDYLAKSDVRAIPLSFERYAKHAHLRAS